MKLTNTFVEEIRDLIASAHATVKKGVELMRRFFLLYADRRSIAQSVIAQLNGVTKSQSLVAQSDTPQKVQSPTGELGKGFLFEARQKRFTFDGEHYFVDLVFYNRLLRCYVLLDLKLGRLTHQDLGQMQMYVNYFDREAKADDENSTIGIILCKQKNKALVEITLPEDANIHAREYQLYLPSKEELQEKLVEWVRDENTGDE